MCCAWAPVCLLHEIPFFIFYFFQINISFVMINKIKGSGISLPTSARGTTPGGPAAGHPYIPNLVGCKQLAIAVEIAVKAIATCCADQVRDRRDRSKPFRAPSLRQ